MHDFDPKAYGAAFAAVLSDPPPMPLDAGRANQAMRAALEDLSDSGAGDLRIADRGAFDCCLAGAWLLHGFLDEAHTLCQDVPTPSGSYWHGVMHRREGDYGNASYWFRRAGDHPVGSLVASAAATHPATVEAALGGAWDPHRFNDQIRQAVTQGGPLAKACQEVQWAEWRALFDYDWRQAIEA